MTVRFVITDTAKDIPGRLHRHPSRPVPRRQGRRGAGQAGRRRRFAATEVLAKHDENYMPPEGKARRRPGQKAQQRPNEQGARHPGRKRPGTAKTMTPELGHFALILAFAGRLAQGVLPLVGAQRNTAWIALARPAAQTQFVLSRSPSAAWPRLVSRQRLLGELRRPAFQYPVADPVPLFRRLGRPRGLAAALGADAAGWVPRCRCSRATCRNHGGARVGVLGLVGIGLLAFMLFTSNPFERLLPAAAEGRDLNPLLQDPGLVFHPPMLYMGYVGFSVAFAFAIAALISGRLDAAWARWSRPWTTAAWVFLTLGIALGSWWAYYELGWGGWWFWDPVENASFMPWLVGTALIHSLAVTEKRGAFKNWTVLLAIAAFSLSLLGTFLVRSGVLTSVHAFATDPRRGIFILALLVVVVGSSLLLFAWRAPKVSAGGAFGLVSRETMLLMNNVLLVVATGSVLLGTLYPLLIDALGMGKLSVGPPYFNAVFVPVMVPLLLLMAVGPMAHWKHADLKAIAAPPARQHGTGRAAGIALPLLMGAWTPLRDEFPARGVDRRQRRVPDHGAAEDRQAAAPSGACISRTSASPCSSSASPWSAATRRRRTCAWSRATPCRSAATASACRGQERTRPQLPCLGRNGRTVEGRQAS
jgi:hypothetical protein